MKGLMLHCGGLPATFEEIAQVELPVATETYRPIPHGDIVRLVEEEMYHRFRLRKNDRAFGLNNQGNQMFGVLKYDLFSPDNPDVDIEQFLQMRDNLTVDQLKQYGLSIGVRNSYDKTITAALAGGLNTFVCDNLCFHGDFFTIMRKHTKNSWDDLVPMVMTAVRSAAIHYTQTVKFQEHMKLVPCSLERGYEVIGRARGTGLITPTQCNEIIDVWRICVRHHHDNVKKGETPHTFRDHGDNAYGLFNSFTHGLKLGNIRRKMDEYTGVSSMFQELGLSPNELPPAEEAKLIEDAVLV